MTTESSQVVAASGGTPSGYKTISIGGSGSSDSDQKALARGFALMGSRKLTEVSRKGGHASGVKRHEDAERRKRDNK